MRIHQVVAVEELRHEVDPIRGVIARRETVLKQGSSTHIAGGEHGSFDIDDDGSFEVPDELGEFFVKQPGWYEGVNPLAKMPVKKAGNGKA